MIYTGLFGSIFRIRLVWTQADFSSRWENVFPYTKGARSRRPMLDAASHCVTYSFDIQRFRVTPHKLRAKAPETGSVRQS